MVVKMVDWKVDWMVHSTVGWMDVRSVDSKGKSLAETKVRNSVARTADSKAGLTADLTV